MMSNDEQAAGRQTFSMLDALSLEMPSVLGTALRDSRATGQHSLELQRILQMLRQPPTFRQSGYRMSQGPQDAEGAIELGMTQRCERVGNAEVDTDVVTHSLEEEAAAAEEEEDYRSETSSVSTSLGLATHIGSEFDDSGAEQEVLAEADFGAVPEEVPSPRISVVGSEKTLQ
eukprot:TRINITY_DN1848_c0_g4_i1.p1 TRINITY_DN1848_c0_g4~~TRINITY_DN1848_c0_g4_i1.p1  ORF type:complete len:173 (-),score=38.42 TRINITY_DN1848_c0_g4_i1:102-620(-)